MNPVGTREVTCSASEKCEFWRKLKMSFISKTVRDRVILNNVCTLWVLETLDISACEKS